MCLKNLEESRVNHQESSAAQAGSGLVPVVVYFQVSNIDALVETWQMISTLKRTKVSAPTAEVTSTA